MCCTRGPPEKLQRWRSDGCECELMLVNMIGLSFPQVQLLLLNTVFLQLLC